MKNLTLAEVAKSKSESINRHEQSREITGNAVADQRIEFIERMSDEEYMNMVNEAARRESAKSEEKKEKVAAISTERKATGKSKKTYRAEYDALMAEYKTTGNIESYKQAKAIAKFSF